MLKIKFKLILGNLYKQLLAIILISLLVRVTLCEKSENTKIVSLIGPTTTLSTPLTILTTEHVVILNEEKYHNKNLVIIQTTNQDPDDFHFQISGRLEEKVCIGTNGRMSVPNKRAHHYRNLRDRYTNCTYVEGNLELTWLEHENMDLTFLENIREVTGYVLISHVSVKKIVLPSLQVIRGRTKFRLNVHDDEFALMVTLSKMESLELPALRDILAGNVGVFNNYNLCHVKTITWDEIISGPNAKYVYVYNFTQPERDCSPCDSSCEAGCWGEGPENCQKFSKINCSPQCHEGRCFGREPRQCCHLSCAGGCTGPRKSDCLACKKFYDDGECKDECPPLVVYNPNTYLSERNPNGKYSYGATCVKTCPEHLLRDPSVGACVRQCAPDKEARDGECTPCSGPCPKKCQGPTGNGVIHSSNIDKFKDCTIIEGSITILETSFTGFQEVHQNFTFGERYTPMNVDKLEVFSTLKEITGYLRIEANNPNFTDLNYFRNLEVIGGRDKADYFSSLYIVKTSLISLNLRSLKKIRSGGVSILENQNLCFASTIDWRKILRTPRIDHQVQNNRLEEECEKDGQVCSSQCSEEGCWGAEPIDCLSCAKYRLGVSCIPSCNSTIGIYESSPGICEKCHEQCDKTCKGPGTNNCTKCKNVKDGPFCVEKCPERKYNLEGECLPCHENCLDGCTGPDNTIGFKGCNSCHQALVNENGFIERCLGKDEICPTGYFEEFVNPKELGTLKPLAGKSVCKKCHPNCKTCTAFGFHTSVCHECTFFKRGEQCEESCELGHYADLELKECFRCADECDWRSGEQDCHGPTPGDCYKCRNFKIYSELPALDGEKQQVDLREINRTNLPFVCTASCPPEYPFRIVNDNEDPFCSAVELSDFDAERHAEQRSAIIVGSVVVLVILAIFLTILAIHCVKAKTKENTMKITMAMTNGFEDSEPLRPTNVKPNLNKFRTVKEEELRKGGILGCGAFGTVYKGVWIPEGQNVKIPVAIKVLKEGTGVNTSKEFLDEAYLAACVEHPHLLKLLAVCLTSQLMLVTQLMPLGCLRDYASNNRDKIGSKAILNWATQIAKGMEYLETRRLVHRDLAARNVLVQTPSFVKITDFGLAKLLDLDEDEYRAEGGKMPIKWLALECIRDRIFTHKSDVWAFGVTVWELLTYGEPPYRNISAREVPEILLRGERLEQPPFCTLELYMIIIKCWMVDPEARPNFKELVEEFSKMSRDPGRYLVIPGDKLMRLPSYTQQDERELMRNLASAMDGPELLMDAEEYVYGAEPTSGHNHQSSASSNNRLHPNSTTKSVGGYFPGGSQCSDDESLSSSSRLNPHHLTQQQQRYLLSHNRPNHGNNIEDSSDDRYCSDPLKMPLKKGRRGNVVDLPLDDEDYLVPSPQANNYLDLEGQGQSTNIINNININNKNNGIMLRQNVNNLILVDNPEYQLMNNQNQHNLLAFGLPTTNININNSETNAQSQYLPYHTYYNDLSSPPLSPDDNNVNIVNNGQMGQIQVNFTKMKKKNSAETTV